MNSQFKFKNTSCLRTLSIASFCLLVLSSCATRPASVPDLKILTEIQSIFEAEIVASEPVVEAYTEDDNDLLNELLPSLALDENLLAPVEERISVTSPNMQADQFFSSLLLDTNYGVVVAEDVDVQINLSLPNVTIEEIMDTVAEIYNLDISLRGNIYTVRPGGLRTRQFTIDYLNVQRTGNSSTSITSSGNQGGGGGGNFGGGGGFGNAGNFGGIDPSLLAASGGGLNAGNFGGGIGGGIGGGGGGGSVTTSTSTDFWSDLETAISNLIGITGSGSSSSGGSGGGGAPGGFFGGIGGGAGSGNQSTVTAEGKSVLVIPLTGMVIVTAFPRELDSVEAFINQAQEILRREVIIQVQFVEVVLNKGFQYALDFNTFGRQANDVVTGSGAFLGDAEGLLGSNNDQAAEYLSGDIGIGAIANPLQFSTNFSDFDAVFRLLQSRGTTQIISSPQLRVLNNQKALFQAGSQEFFQTQSSSSTVASSSATTTSEENDLEQFFSGISMDITPQISATGEITLHVHPVVSAVDPQSKSIGGQIVPLALTTTREMDSVIKARNGRIVVLGGLAFERNINETAGIPGLSQVPLLGDVLEQKQTESVKSEFIILLKPIMVTEEGDRDVLTESKDRFRELSRAIDPFLNN